MPYAQNPSEWNKGIDDDDWEWLIRDPFLNGGNLAFIQRNVLGKIEVNSLLLKQGKDAKILIEVVITMSGMLL